MRKPSPRAVLKMLPPEIQDRLADYVDSHTLKEGVEYCRDELKVATNDTSLSDWLAWYKMCADIRENTAEMEAFKAELATTKVDPDLIPKLGNALFLAKSAKAGDIKSFAMVCGVMQRDAELKAQQAAHADKMRLGEKQISMRGESLKLMSRKLENAERRINVLEALKEQAKQAATKAKSLLKNGVLSDEDRAALTATLDEVILGRKKPAAKEAKA